MEWIVVWPILAILVGYYNKNKGNGFFGAFIVSMLLSPLIGFLVALIQKPNAKVVENQAIRSGAQKKCPACAELVKAEATVCRFCQKAFV